MRHLGWIVGHRAVATSLDCCSGVRVVFNRDTYIHIIT